MTTLPPSVSQAPSCCLNWVLCLHSCLSPDLQMHTGHNAQLCRQYTVQARHRAGSAPCRQASITPCRLYTAVATPIWSLKSCSTIPNSADFASAGFLWGHLRFICLQVVRERFMGPTCTFLLEQLPLTTSLGPKSRSLVTECCSGNDRQAGEARRQAKQKPRQAWAGSWGKGSLQPGDEERVSWTWRGQLRDFRPLLSHLQMRSPGLLISEVPPGADVFHF